MTAANTGKIDQASIHLKKGLGLLLTFLLCAAAFCGRAENGASPTARTSIQKSHFGNLPDGAEIELYTLTNTHGIICKVINYGGVITELHVPDRNGKAGNIVLGFAQWQEYLKNGPYFGAICGRVANRISNSRFMLDGQTYKLVSNNGSNQLHGGLRGLTRVLWQAETTNHSDSVSLRLTHTSPDGEEGFPGTVKFIVTYTLNDRDELELNYEATTDKATPVNLSNHTYWNLTGEGEITNQVLAINADRYTPSDTGLIPTGEISPVKDTPLDFQSRNKGQALEIDSATLSIGAHIEAFAKSPLKKNASGGFDNNFVVKSEESVDGRGPVKHQAALAFDPASGRVLEVWSTAPCVQLYTFHSGNGFLGNDGHIYRGFAAFCLESQDFPDSVNHPEFPQCILHPGETYRQTTTWRFSARK